MGTRVSWSVTPRSRPGRAAAIRIPSPAMSAELSECVACPRLAGWLAASRASHPEWHSRPVGRYGEADASLLVIGLAPGMRGANRTGIPFCGDPSGDWLWRALFRTGFADAPRGGAGLRRAAITDVVKCAPPGNRPTGVEARTCRERWLAGELEGEPAGLWVALGRLAWEAPFRVLGRKAPPFRHGGEASLEVGGRSRTLLASFHPSPLNTQTGRLSEAAFIAVFKEAAARLGVRPALGEA
jgi:uracil-DNA glycosylase family 4